VRKIFAAGWVKLGTMKLLPALLLLATAPLTLAAPRAALPPAVDRPVDFAKDIQPLFEAACIKCHAKGKDKGGFSLETRESFLKGGETEAGAVVGKSAESYIVELVAGVEPDSIMPKKGSRWTPEQVGLLRSWIDQGAVWPAGITFAKPPPENLQAHKVTLAERPAVQPIDDLLATYFAAKGIAFPAPVEDCVFARRAYLDLVGLLPTPAQLDAFLQDQATDKRTQLVRRLLADNRNYADHWLTFWNDLLRNDYKGTGFIDGGRKQISGWLYQSLIEDKPYDRFVSELVNPTRASEGFSRGIIWRGNVNASMLPPMQAAQNVSQVFLGVNLKCASCHDSFVNDWSLADAYGLAAVYSDEPMELIHCDKPTGKKSAPRFLYPEIGALDPALPKAARLQRLAEIMTSEKNGRLSRTIVNRFWARLFGRGLVEPIDDMEQPAWNRDLLDWLAEDLVAHKYDLKRTLEVICSSLAYQLPTVESPREKEAFVFRGPLTRRLTAEQFSDALSSLSGDWNRLPSSLEFDFGAGGLAGGLKMPQWVWTAEPLELGPQRASARAAGASLADAVKNLTAAQKKAGDAAAQGGAALEEARKLVEQGTAAVNTAQWYLNDATRPRPEPAPDALLPESDRHRVIFRKSFPLTAVPTEAYGAILVSQSWQVQVNGREAKPIQRDGFRNGRIALFDLKPLLQVGENTIVINVSSHTEKQMNDVERAKFPGSLTHLNKVSGLAFYARVGLKDQEPLQITTDATWRVRRNPEGRWGAVDYADSDWARTQPLPAGVTPVDEGPSLQPITRKDFANLPVELGPQLSPVVSTAAHVGEIRASLLAADPLQVALDRPNREIVTPVRLSAATTIQALELTNGTTLNTKLQKAAAKFLPEVTASPAAWLDKIYRHALGRRPSPSELGLAQEILGQPMAAEGVTDFLWMLVNHPEFQLIN
jgi:mono/diheme cytochrome c family protein